MKLELAEQIRLPREQLEAFLARVLERLGPEDHAIARGHVEAVRTLLEALGRKGVSIQRLRELVFGPSTETLKNVLASEKAKRDGSQKGRRRRRRKGHGRNGTSAYPGAKQVKVPHPTVRPGDRCPRCRRGKLYDSGRPGRDLRLLGQAPIEATVYTSQILRCNLCGELFRPRLPEEAGEQKYDPTVASVVALLKYGSGMPFYRLEKLQQSLGIPLPAATQWQLVQEAAGIFRPVHEQLLLQGAQGQVLHNDDTTMRVLALEKRDSAQEVPKGDEERRGVFTSGIISLATGHEIALFFTGRRHAGENLAALLAQRQTALGPPIQMCDALSRNFPQPLQTILSNCLAHGRRKFVEVAGSFPQEVRYVLEQLAQVYRVDEEAKERRLSPEARLQLHQQESASVMEELRQWMEERLSQRLVEPNSSLGEAIQYVLKRWERMTLFLRQPGAPLDNNIVERALKLVILHRKNALFYKTPNGAAVGDRFMSLIHTARLAGANPFHYLTVLQRHAEWVAQKPAAWLPWNYQEALAALDTS